MVNPSKANTNLTKKIDKMAKEIQEMKSMKDKSIPKNARTQNQISSFQ